jgi:hypothetical protein
MLDAYQAMGNLDSIARILSFMIRASLRKSEQAELYKIAEQYGVTNNPEFIA